MEAALLPRSVLSPVVYSKPQRAAAAAAAADFSHNVNHKAERTAAASKSGGTTKNARVRKSGYLMRRMCISKVLVILSPLLLTIVSMVPAASWKVASTSSNGMPSDAQQGEGDVGSRSNAHFSLEEANMDKSAALGSLQPRTSSLSDESDSTLIGSASSSTPRIQGSNNSNSSSLINKNSVSASKRRTYSRLEVPQSHTALPPTTRMALRALAGPSQNNVGQPTLAAHTGPTVSSSDCTSSAFSTVRVDRTEVASADAIDEGDSDNELSEGQRLTAAAVVAALSIRQRDALSLSLSKILSRMQLGSPSQRKFSLAFAAAQQSPSFPAGPSASHRSLGKVEPPIEERGRNRASHALIQTSTGGASRSNTSKSFSKTQRSGSREAHAATAPTEPGEGAAPARELAGSSPEHRTTEGDTRLKGLLKGDKLHRNSPDPGPEVHRNVKYVGDRSERLKPDPPPDSRTVSEARKKSSLVYFEQGDVNTGNGASHGARQRLARAWEAPRGAQQTSNAFTQENPISSSDRQQQKSCPSEEALWMALCESLKQMQEMSDEIFNRGARRAAVPSQKLPVLPLFEAYHQEQQLGRSLTAHDLIRRITQRRKESSESVQRSTSASDAGGKGSLSTVADEHPKKTREVNESRRSRPGCSDLYLSIPCICGSARSSSARTGRSAQHTGSFTVSKCCISTSCKGQEQEEAGRAEREEREPGAPQATVRYRLRRHEATADARADLDGQIKRASMSSTTSSRTEPSVSSWGPRPQPPLFEVLCFKKRLNYDSRSEEEKRELDKSIQRMMRVELWLNSLPDSFMDVPEADGTGTE